MRRVGGGYVFCFIVDGVLVVEMAGGLLVQASYVLFVSRHGPGYSSGGYFVVDFVLVFYVSGAGGRGRSILHMYSFAGVLWGCIVGVPWYI